MHQKSLTFASRVLNIYNVSPLYLSSATCQLNESRWVMTRDESRAYMSHEPTCPLRVMTLYTLERACESWVMTHEPWVMSLHVRSESWLYMSAQRVVPPMWKSHVPLLGKWGARPTHVCCESYMSETWLATYMSETHSCMSSVMRGTTQSCMSRVTWLATYMSETWVISHSWQP